MRWSALPLAMLSFFGSTLIHANTDIQQLEQRLIAPLAQDNMLTRYHAHKAKMWLSYAKNEASEGSLTVAGQEALQHSQTLLNGLDQHAELSLATPILSVSQVMRRDLWWQLEYLKQHGAIQVAPQALAEAEVMLVWAAGEYCELGWRHAREHFWAVERRIDAISEAMGPLPQMQSAWKTTTLPSLEELNGKGCRGVNMAHWPMLSTPVMQPQPAAVVPVETAPLVIENVVHFALDRAELNAEGKAVLDRIAALLKEEPDLSITLQGHTDMRASVAYNLRLSQRRIDTVRRYLEAQGVAAHRIAEQAKGKAELISDAEQRIGHAKSRRVEVLFYDIEGKDIHVQPQWRDLQLESD